MHKLLIYFVVVLLLLGCNSKKSQEMDNSSLRYIFTPPSDLYELIVNEEIDIGENGYQKEVDFTIKYPGLYSIGIISDRYPPKVHKSQYDELTLRLKLEFFDKESLIMSIETEGPILHFASKQGNGLWLAKFNTTNILPVNKTIRCKFEVSNSDSFFSEKYGDSILFIKKASEK